MNVFFEARGEPPECWQWIMDNMRNRVNNPSWPNTYHGVLSDIGQYVWYNKQGRDIFPEDPFDWFNILVDALIEDPKNNRDLDILLMIRHLAVQYYIFQPEDKTEGALYYWTNEADKRMNKVVVSKTKSGECGNHLFFSNVKWR